MLQDTALPLVMPSQSAGRMPAKLRETIACARRQPTESFRTYPSVATWLLAPCRFNPVHRCITSSCAAALDRSQEDPDGCRPTSSPGSQESTAASTQEQEDEPCSRPDLCDDVQVDSSQQVRRLDQQGRRGSNVSRFSTNDSFLSLGDAIDRDDLALSGALGPAFEGFHAGSFELNSPLAPTEALSRAGVQLRARTPAGYNQRQHSLPEAWRWARELSMHCPLVGSPKGVSTIQSVLASAASPSGSSAKPALLADVACWVTPEETLVFFDWDDTLCPSTWIEDDPRLDWWKPCPCFGDRTMKLKPSGRRQEGDVGQSSPFFPLKTGKLGGNSDADDHCMLEALERHTAAVSALLRAAAEVGQIVIVTIARAGWIDASIRNFMPGLDAVLAELNIEIVYARDAISMRRVKGAVADGMDPWMLMKKAGMRKALKRFYSKSSGRNWKNCISIGDSQVENRALSDLVFNRQQVDRNGLEIPVRCKTLKLLDEPSLGQLTQQIDIMASFVALLAQYDGDLSCDFQDLHDGHGFLEAARMSILRPMGGA